MKLADCSVCSGCGLCKYICPNAAIMMVPDEEGFFYPQIDADKCIECGRCNRICPVINKDKISRGKVGMQKVYAGYQKDVNELLQSSSGGAAFAIAKGFIQSGGVVFGVIYTPNYRGTIFASAKSVEELVLMRESKYVESDRSALYEELMPTLNAGYKVLVIGLPCDISAVRSLAGAHDNLYTCKLLCRSNTSNKALGEFIENLERENNSDIKRLSLRYKVEGAPRFPTKCRIDFADGTTVISDFVKTDYGKAFQILARPSCLDCAAKTIDDLADLTLGDFQGANPKREYYNTNGLSLIVEHNKKGQELMEFLTNFYLQDMPYEEVMAYNWMLNTSIPKSPLRDQFSEDFINYGLEKACKNLVLEQNQAIDKISAEMVENQCRVAIWGIGDTTENLFDRFGIDKWNLRYVFDSSSLKIGNSFKGMKILPIHDIMKYVEEIDVLAVMIPSENEEKLNRFLKDLGWKKRVIHTGKYKFYKN